MPLPVQIVGLSGAADVTPQGQQIVAPIKYDETSFQELNVINTAFSFYQPLPNQQFVITSITVVAKQNVSNTVHADLVIYEATSETETTVEKVLLQQGIKRADILPLLPLNLLVNPGVWINAKTTDADITMTIMGYYINVVK